MAEKDEWTFVKDQQLLEKADDLTSQLLSETSASKAAMLRGKIEGLLHLAHIRSLATQYDNSRETAEFRARELAAMEAVADKIPQQAPCGAASPQIYTLGGQLGTEHCRWPAGHDGPHKSPQGTEWNSGGVAESLRAQVTYFLAQHQGAAELADANRETGADLTAIDYNARAETWKRAAEMLQQTLQEGGLL